MQAKVLGAALSKVSNVPNPEVLIKVGEDLYPVKGIKGDGDKSIIELGDKVGTPVKKVEQKVEATVVEETTEKVKETKKDKK